MIYRPLDVPYSCITYCSAPVSLGSPSAATSAYLSSRRSSMRRWMVMRRHSSGSCGTSFISRQWICAAHKTEESLLEKHHFAGRYQDSGTAFEPCPLRAEPNRLPGHERSFDDVVAGFAHVRGNLEPARIEKRGQIRQHRRTAADHDPVMGGIERRHSGVLEQLARLDELGDAPLIAEPLPGDGRKVNQLVSDQLAEIFMVRQFPLDEIPIRELASISHAVDQNDFLEALVRRRILDQAHERGEPRA